MSTPTSTIITCSFENSAIQPAVGIAPLGYHKIFLNDRILVVPKEKTAPNVILAFELAGKGKSFREILAVLKSRGLKSSRGKDLSLSSLHNMLTNPFYMGYVCWRGRVTLGMHKPLISKLLFQKVQRNLHRRRC